MLGSWSLRLLEAPLINVGMKSKISHEERGGGYFGSAQTGGRFLVATNLPPYLSLRRGGPG